MRELLKLAHDQLANNYSKIAIARILVDANLPQDIRECEEKLNALQAATDWKQKASRDLVLQGRLAALSEKIGGLFDPVWRVGSAYEPPAAVDGESAEHKLVDQVELFIACRSLDFLRRVYGQMMNLAVFAVAGIVALMLASSSYPMPAPETGLSLAWLALLTVVGVIIYVFVRIDMNGVISLLQGTTPGYFSVTSSFVAQLLIFGVVPILAMLGAQFPHVLAGIFSWIAGVFSPGR